MADVWFLLRFRALTLIVFVCCCVLAGCGGSTAAQSGTPPGPPPIPSGTPPPPPPGGTTPITHVAVVMVENHRYEDVIGSAAMPYLNGLATQSALAVNYYANTHPSSGNYFMLTTGQLVGDDTFAGTVTDDNVVRELTAAGKQWKSYQQSIPAVGYTGPDVYPYVRHHNPFSFLSDVLDNPAQQQNLVPLTQLSADLAAHALPNYLFIVPDQVNNAHDCPPTSPNCTDADRLATADKFLADNIAPLLADQEFQTNGVLIVLFDESVTTDVVNGGGHVAMIMAGAQVKKAIQPATFFQHQSTLRFTLEVLGVKTWPGAGATAPSMFPDFF